MAGNREYKSDVFSMLMEDKGNALQIYNALNNSSYRDPNLVEICTLDRGVSLSVRNDAAFVLDANLSIYEHQSTVCPNMPVRCLIYFTSIIGRILKDHNIYGKTMIRIPTPKFAIFYNGAEEQPEQYDLKLSNAFERPVEDPELELTCRVYNINQGRNRELLDKCPMLKEYMIFVDYVREYHRKEEYDNLETAINMAIDRCIEEGVLRQFLIENRLEVVKVTQLDYTFDRQIELEREDARREGREAGLAEGHEAGLAEGREAGLAEGREEIVKNMVHRGMSDEEIKVLVACDQELVDEIRKSICHSK